MKTQKLLPNNKTAGLLSVFLFTSLLLTAQNNLPISYGSGSFFHLQGANYQPSKLGDSYTTLDINFLNLYAWADNSFVGYNSLRKMFISQNITTEEAEKLVNDLKKSNALTAGTRFQPIAVAYKFTRKSTGFRSNNPDLANYPYLRKDEILTVSLEINERAESNIIFANTIGQLAWYGNKRFAGQTLDIGELNVNAFYQREIVVGVAAPIKLPVLNPKKYSLRVGARAKYLMGIVSVRTQNIKGELKTETIENGATISLNNFIYDIRSANGSIGNNFTTNKLLKPVGWGIGFDLGATLTYKKNYAVSLSFLDLGAMRYTKNIESYTANAATTFDGITLISDGQDRPAEIVDTLTNRLRGEQNNNSFTAPLPTRMVLQVEYKIPRETQAQGYRYNEHHFYLTYIQGFLRYGGSTATPFFSLGYDYDFRTKFNWGISASYGGYGRLGVGTWAGFRVGAFRLGLGSSNLMGLLSPDLGYGADLSFNIGIGFY